jgi:uncharacterized protein YjbJ (UPF0337 family)
MEKDSLRDRGMKNEIEGTAKEIEGKVRDGVADLTGDTSEQIKGKAKTVEGKVQKNVGRAQQDADDGE